MKKQSLYLETSFISYLVGRLNQAQITLTRQLLSREFWEDRRSQYQLFASQAVVDEICRGNEILVTQRKKIIDEIDLLEVNDEVIELAKLYFKELQIPEDARPDSIHLAVASYHIIDYVLTWNLTHLANPVLLIKFDRINQKIGRHTPMIVTPENLLP